MTRSPGIVIALQRLSLLVTLLGLAVAGPWIAHVPNAVRADDLTPVTALPTSESTLVPEVTELPTTVAPLPPVSAEQSSPVVTIVPTAVPRIVVKVPTVPPTVAPTPTSVVRIVPSATPVPVQAVSPAPPYVPLPSAAELEQNARLRWGDRVPPQVRRWAFLIVPIAHHYHLSPNLIAAVITMESNGDPLAWNGGSDARGLMQVLHGPWSPKANIRAGARMLADFIDQFGDLKLALAAYNAGPNAVTQYGGVPPYRETRDYVIVVAYLFDLYRNHLLTHHRKAQYRSTLKDLQKFADARKKVRVLAEIADVKIDAAMVCRHFGSECVTPVPHPHIRAIDPFWPVADRPDPLLHVRVPADVAGKPSG